mmetsp:Transcript_2255/g.5149  ORF Transcript_2255/g.5149 Transcript_2255/m.5149 type:complete len:255 (+) Transcript_2255:731-1495(+)
MRELMLTLHRSLPGWPSGLRSRIPSDSLRNGGLPWGHALGLRSSRGRSRNLLPRTIGRPGGSSGAAAAAVVVVVVVGIGVVVSAVHIRGAGRAPVSRMALARRRSWDPFPDVASRRRPGYFPVGRRHACGAVRRARYLSLIASSIVRRVGGQALGDVLDYRATRWRRWDFDYRGAGRRPWYSGHRTARWRPWYFGCCVSWAARRRPWYFPSSLLRGKSFEPTAALGAFAGLVFGLASAAHAGSRRYWGGGSSKG